MSNYKLFGRNYWGLDEMVNMLRITLVSGVIWGRVPGSNYLYLGVARSNYKDYLSNFEVWIRM